MTKRKAPLPTMDDIVSFLNDNAGRVGKKEIARAFHIRGDDRIKLKEMLSDMKRSGKIEKSGLRGKKIISSDGLPELCPSEITGTDSDGELIARPLNWDRETPCPQIVVTDLGKLRPPPKEGDRVVLKLSAAGKRLFYGAVVRRITAEPNRIVGVFDTTGGKGGRILSADRRLHLEYYVDAEHSKNAKNGDLVAAELTGQAFLKSKKAKIVAVLGNVKDPKSASLIALHLHGIPVDFTPQALKQAEKAKIPPLENRVDLREVPLVTIDGEDARDFDDAVFAEPDDDPKNEGGWKLLIAIADVAYFVRPFDALDKCARERGNSVYFPDRVVPMLPEALSAGLCSLKPDQDRPCLAVRIKINKNGRIVKFKFMRAMMRSAARLNYHEVQAVFDGGMPEMNGTLRECLTNLYGAYQALARARTKRGALEIDVPEREVVLDENGRISRICARERFDSHRAVEEFMIAANVAAAQMLESKNIPVMYRIHEAPAAEKVASLQTFLGTLGIKTPKRSDPETGDFNKILDQVKDTPRAFMVNELVLRTQSQARYSPDNAGHFGLALEKYAHFTSPIRRYADLLVHRGIIRALKAGEGGLSEEDGSLNDDFEDLGEHISATERRAAAAERDAEERYLSSYLADRIGERFNATVNGVSRFGLFVVLDDIAAEGLVPISTLPGDYYVYEEDRHRLFGSSTGKSYELGERVELILSEARPVTGGLLFHLLDSGAKKPSQKSGRGKKAAKKGFRKKNYGKRK